MKWISMEDEWPENGKVVLCADELNSFVSLGQYRDDDDEDYFNLMWIADVEGDTVITHWMPLPPAPERGT